VWRPPRMGVKGSLETNTERPLRGRRVKSARSDHITGPDTAEGDTRLLHPGPLEGPGSLWKLAQTERKPG